ncbi:beta strand repeat-containing protein, partial [Desulfovibrio piger]
MQLTKGAIGNLINRYKAVLKKCHLMNTFGSLAVAGMLIMGGAGVATAADDKPLGGGSQEWSGDADHLMGGNLYKGNVTVPGETTPGDISLSIKGGTIEEIIGGSYVSGNNDQVGNVTLGNISTTIQDGSSTEFVVGGSKISNDADATLATGKTSLTINGGTFGTEGKTNAYELVMGGNYIKTGTDTKNKASAEGSRVTVNDGTFHASVVGGSVAHRYNGNNSIMVEDNGSTSVVINGGTFSPSQSNIADSNGGINLTAAVIGGGLAYGGGSSVLGSDTQDVTSSVTINGGTFGDNGHYAKIVAGSVVANNGGTAIVHGNTTLSMAGGKAHDDLIGGGMVENAATLPKESTSKYNLNITGDSSVKVTGGEALGEVIGGNYVKTSKLENSAKLANSAKVANSSVTITGGKFAGVDVSKDKAQYIIGGSKTNASEGGNATTLVEGNSSVLIDGAVTIEDGALIGGSQAKAGNGVGSKATATVKGNSSVTVNKGTLAGVIGGGIAETYWSSNGEASSTVTGTSSVTINGGNVTGNSIETGAVAGNTGKLSAAVVGGGLANTTDSTATVGSTSVTIADGTINGKVVAGGVAVNGGSSTVTGDTRLTMTGGKVDGDLIGGGFVDMNNATDNKANVEGSTHITVSGGSLVDAEIIGGGSVRNATGEANVNKDTHVTVTKYDNSQDKQTWVQYVFGGGKAMTNGEQTATADVTGSTNVTIGEQGAAGEALKIEFGTVAGGGLARAQEGGGSATATVKNANVIVHSGILSGVAGGGIAEYYGAGSAEATVTNANLTINGGTIKGVKYQGVDTNKVKVKVAVLGGGIAKGAGAIANATTTNTVINGGTIEGHVVAGGLADGGTATVGTANLTIKGGEINGSVYAGGAKLKSGTASVDNFKVLITGGTITGDVVAGDYTVETTETEAALLTLSSRSTASKGTITIGGDAKIDGKVDASAEGVETNVVIDGADKVTGVYEGNKDSTLTFNNYNDKFNNTATGFGNLNVAEGSNVEMDNLSTGAKGDTEADKGKTGFFGGGTGVDVVTVNGKGTVKAENVTATDGKTITVADGSTLDAQKLITKQEGSTTGGSVKTAGLGSTLIIGNENLNDIDDHSLNSTAGNEIKFTGLSDEVNAGVISAKLGTNEGIVNVGDTKVAGLSERVVNGEVSYTDWTGSSTDGITNNELKKTTLTGVDSPVTKTGSFGSAELDESIDTLTVGNSLTLTGLDGSNNFVSKADKAANATIANDAKLTLGDNTYAGDKGIGKIEIGNNATLNVLGQSAAAATVNSGAITATTAATGTKVNAKNVTLNVAGDIGAETQAIGTITADAANIKATGDVTAGDIDLVKGGSVTSDKDIKVNGPIEDADGTLQAGGNITAEGQNLTQANNGKLTVVAGGTIKAANISATNVAAKKLTAGAVAVDGGTLDLTGTGTDVSKVASLKLTNGTQAKVADLELTGAGTITVGTGDDAVGGTTLSAKHINLKEGMLLVDPDWGLPSSNVAVASLSETASETDVTVNGSVGVGRNSYLALGTDNTGWLRGVVGNYTKGVGLSKDGITAALGVFDSIKIADTKGLVVDGSLTNPGLSAAIVSNTAKFGANSLLVVNGANIYGDKAAITFAHTGGGNKLTVDNTSRLVVTDAVAGQDYTIVGNVENVETVQDGTSTPTPIANGGTVWKTEGLSTTTDMISLGDAVFTQGSAGTPDKVTTAATRNDAHTVFPNLSDGMANAVNDLYTSHAGAAGKPRWDYADVNSADMGVRFLSRATDNRFLGMDKEAAAATIESAARIAFAGAVPQMTKMASDAGTNAVVNRLGFADPADGAQAMDADGKIVDRNTTGFALWIAPLWQSQHGWGMDADTMDYGFNGNLGGVSLGADYTFENAIR